MRNCNHMENKSLEIFSWIFTLISAATFNELTQNITLVAACCSLLLSFTGVLLNIKNLLTKNKNKNV